MIDNFIFNVLPNDRKDYRWLFVWRLVGFLKTLWAGGSFGFAFEYITDKDLK